MGERVNSSPPPIFAGNRSKTRAGRTVTRSTKSKGRATDSNGSAAQNQSQNHSSHTTAPAAKV